MALTDYLSFGAVAAPTTIFEGRAAATRTLPDLAAGGTRIGEYWDVPRRGVVYRDEAVALEAFDEVFSEAVRARLVSDVPLGAFLSGGIDSSAVVEKMARLSDRPV